MRSRQFKCVYKPFRKLREFPCDGTRDCQSISARKDNRLQKRIHIFIAEPACKGRISFKHSSLELVPFLRHALRYLVACHAVIGEDKAAATGKGREQSANDHSIIYTGNSLCFARTVREYAEGKREAEGEGQQSMRKLFQRKITSQDRNRAGSVKPLALCVRPRGAYP